MEQSTREFLDRMKYASEIHCPHCDEQYVDDEYQHVSYHGEESREEVQCGSCSENFWLKEHVERTYTTAKTREGLDD